MGRGTRRRAPARRGVVPAGLPDPWGAPVLFHYTRPDHAVAIFDERAYLVSARADPEFGTGFWVTDIAPQAMNDEDVRATLFPGRPIEYVHGVVVIARRPEFEQVRAREFLWKAAAGTLIDLRQIAVAVGRRTAGGWVFGPNPLG